MRLKSASGSLERHWKPRCAPSRGLLGCMADKFRQIPTPIVRDGSFLGQVSPPVRMFISWAIHGCLVFIYPLVTNCELWFCKPWVVGSIPTAGSSSNLPCGNGLIK